MDLIALAIYKFRADNLLYSSISELTGSELKQQRSMLFGNILSLLHHVYAMDIAWKFNLEEVPHNFQTRNPEVGVSFKELRTNQIALNAWYEGYFAHLIGQKYMENVCCGRGLSASYYDHNVNDDQLVASVDQKYLLKISHPRNDTDSRLTTWESESALL